MLSPEPQNVLPVLPGCLRDSGKFHFEDEGEDAGASSLALDPRISEPLPCLGDLGRTREQGGPEGSPSVLPSCFPQPPPSSELLTFTSGLSPLPVALRTLYSWVRFVSTSFKRSECDVHAGEEASILQGPAASSVLASPSLHEDREAGGRQGWVWPDAVWGRGPGLAWERGWVFLAGRGQG